jgi:hypothetical protein
MNTFTLEGHTLIHINFFRFFFPTEQWIIKVIIFKCFVIHFYHAIESYEFGNLVIDALKLYIFC